MKSKLLLFSALTLGVTAIAQIPTAGLVAHYAFNGNANDLSGNSNNGTVNGATLTADRLGNANSAYFFDGTSSYIDVPHSSSLTFGTNAISVSFWAKIISVPSSGYNGLILSKQSGSGASQQGFNLFDNTAQTVGLAIRNGATAVSGSNNYSVILNQYHHFTYTFDNGTAASYLDGVQTSILTGQTASIGVNTMSLLIGKANWSNINALNFNGVIDEMQIYNRALTSTEVSEIFNPNTNTTCFSTPDGIDNTWSGGWSYKEYVVPAGFKIDSVYMGATRAGYPTSQEDFVFSFCAGTTNYNNLTSTSPFNYQIDNNSEYNYWINLTSFNYSSTGVVRVFLPVNAGAAWNNLCFALSPSCSANITSGLVAQFDFTGNANDLSGNGNNGTVNGATLTADRFGNTNSAYLFNGFSDYINVLNNSNLNFSNNVSFSISSWIKLTGSNSNYSGIVTKMDGSGNGFQFVVGNNTTIDKLATEFGQGAVGVGFVGNQNLNDGIWHHVMYVVDRPNNKVGFYIDNNLDAQVTSTSVSAANIDNISDLKIGTDRTSAFYFNGALDDIKIYNKALSDCDIDSLFTIPNPMATAISEYSLNSNFSLFPNPAHEKVTIEFNATENRNVTIEVIDLLGKTIQKQVEPITIGNNQLEINLANLSAGIYLIKCNNSIQKIHITK